MGLFGRSKFASFTEKRSQVQSDVSLAVSVIPPLPVPPYPSIDENPKKKQKLLPVRGVRVVVGDSYNFITTGVITRIRVEKIWQESDGSTYVVVSQPSPNGDGRRTHAVHISEFKQRVIAGGLAEVHI